MCTSITSGTISEAIKDINEAKEAEVDTIELRLDFLKDFDPERNLETLMDECGDMPFIVTFRPKWEG